MTTAELRQTRAKLIADARDILDKAETETRDILAEEQTQYDAMMADVDKLKGQIDREERLAGLEKELSESRGTQVGADGLEVADGESGQARTMPRSTEEYREGFLAYMRRGKSALDHDELRALQVGTDSEGGYLVPDEFEKTLVAALEDFNVMRTLATVIQTTNGTTSIPVVSSHGSAAWTAEEAAYTEGDEAFTQATLSAYKAGTIMKVSEELLNDSAFGLEAYIANEYGRRIGALEEAAFVAGDGSSKPTGVVNGSTLGVTAAGAAAITADELMELYHALGRPYRGRATFMMADATALIVRKLKDGNSQYLWQPGLQAGQPDRLLGRPVVISANVPAATTGLKSVIFGDMSYYWIADRQGRAFQRLNELYAANGQVGFRGWQRVDGKLILATAVYHLIQA